MTKSLFKISTVSLSVLHLINRIVDFTAVKASKKPNGKYYHWKHGDIYYKKTGKGEPILLIHDLNVFSSNYEWTKTIKELSTNHTVYAIDLIGCGKSDKPEITYTNYFYVQMVNDFIKDVIKEPVIVAANGLSSSIVLMANTMHSEYYKEIVMINPKTFGFLNKTPNHRSKALLKLFNMPIIGKTAYYIATCKENTDYYLNEKVFYNPFLITNAISKAYYNAAHAGKGTGKMLLASIEASYLNTNIVNIVKNTKTPIKMIVGEFYEKKEEVQKSYCKINPEISCFTVEKSKLLPQYENATAFIKLL